MGKILREVEEVWVLTNKIENYMRTTNTYLKVNTYLKEINRTEKAIQFKVCTMSARFNQTHKEFTSPTVDFEKRLWIPQSCISEANEDCLEVADWFLKKQKDLIFNCLPVELRNSLSPKRKLGYSVVSLKEFLAAM